MPKVNAIVETSIKSMIAVIAPFGRRNYSGYTTVPKLLIGQNVLVEPLAPASKKDMQPIVRKIKPFGDNGAILLMPADWKNVKVRITPTDAKETVIQRREKIPSAASAGARTVKDLIGRTIAHEEELKKKKKEKK